jgi:hypothetical protein
LQFLQLRHHKRLPHGPLELGKLFFLATETVVLGVFYRLERFLARSLLQSLTPSSDGVLD